MLIMVALADISSSVHHYNINDPGIYEKNIKLFSSKNNSYLLIDCTGPFGQCTQEDKDRLGYMAIKKLHEKMDEDSDGEIELHETKEVQIFIFF